MNQLEQNQLPEVSIYAIGPQEADYAAPLLTPEAVSMIQCSGAFGFALTEEDEVRAAVCARLFPENETLLEIISLYVAPKFRRRGLGSTLVLELLERTMETTDASIRFLTVSFPADNHAMSAMLTNLGFEITQDETARSWQLELSKLPDCVLMKRPAPLLHDFSLCPLESLPHYQIRQLVQTLKHYHIDMLSTEQIQQANQQASYVLMNKSNTAIACAIFTESTPSRITLSQFFTAYKKPSPSIAVLQACVQKLLEQFPPETVLEIPTLTNSTGKLVQYLLPDSQAVSLNRAVLDLTRE